MPDWKPEIRRRLAKLKLEPTREAAIIEELAQYLDDCYAEWLSSGATEAEAHQRTLVELSGSELLARELRRAERPAEPIVPGINRRTNIIAALWQDLRFGARMLIKQPGFTLIAVLTLALGIGANTAIFSVVNSVILRPLPYQDPERLVKIYPNNPPAGASKAFLVDARAQVQSFEGMGLFTRASYTLVGHGEAEMLEGAQFTAELFSVLGVQPFLGRTFRPGEDQPGRDQVAVLSYSLWRRRFGADPNVVGQTVTLDGRSHTVIGVMPPSFRYPGQEIQLWVPVTLDPQGRDYRGNYLAMVARLKPGVGLAQAQGELRTVASRLRQANPRQYGQQYGLNATALNLQKDLTGEMQPLLLILFGAVGFVALIACVNVANLLLARATSRQREMAIREALGAGRRRLVRQLLSESVLLSSVGGGVGLLLAIGGVGALISLLPADTPRLEEIAVDRQVLAFTLALSVVTGILFGLLPALQASKLDLHGSLKEGGRGMNLGRGRLRALLVVSEIALAVVLLIGAGLLIKSFWRLQSVDPGFNPENVLSMRLTLPSGQYVQPPQRRAFFQQFFERLAARAGVQAVGAIHTLPLTGLGWNDGAQVEGRPAAPVEQLPLVGWRVVTPNYFKAVSIPLLKGRLLTDDDDETAPKVGVISQTMARQLWPDEDPIGKRVATGIEGRANWVTVVGVVGDIKHKGLSAEAPPEMYRPYTQNSFTSMTVVVRTTGSPLNLAAVVREEVAAVDRSVAISDLQPLYQVVFESISEPRFNMLLLTLFAALALILAVVGSYGVMAYSVTQRTQEIGVRMALGAQRRDALKLVLGQGIRPALVGVVIGMGSALALTRLISSYLYGVTATDPLVFASVALLLLVIALLACYIPARRATRVDPLIALRSE